MIPTNRREARRWVREHWQEFMRGSDIPDLGRTFPDAAAELIFDVWSIESRRLADRLDPRP